ncbi:MAG: CusA/CzcA family heavy metal efflux RND transporter [Bacteroidota bacterium]|nr:CusA/CzcA family heavy metal efflux RND transporter [Bacteroidota bacterium]MDP4231953.1 CusA/CzcA family heavy metal efflux RND transporter [Bacteroidota bacterium]MDP4241340.1 CusA/CzcA family heavy metal efflux RND transporter [Bacteroidota bacterium]MDP4287261.1 CusA/CzcA family heavy metal efflux RND transporter [Bacteroidota bacterium]
MLKKLVELALRERLVVYFTTVLLIVAGIYSFTQLPIEAYPDLTNTRVQVITQWPGRSAEEMEKFVTVPTETEMNGIPHLQNLRSISLFGLSVVTLTFDDVADEFFARTNVTEKLQDVQLPDGVTPQLSPQSGPTGEIYRYTLQSKTRSAMELKTIEDWVLERQFKTVEGVTDVSSFGGPTKQYEIAIDPQKLAYYGVSLKQVSEALQSNNSNAGGSLIEQGNQGYVFRGVGLLAGVNDIANAVVTTLNGTPLKIAQLGDVRIGHAVRLGKIETPNDDDAVEGIVLMRRGENASLVIERVEEKVRQLNSTILPKDVKIVPYYDRADLVGVTTHTVLHNLVVGMLLVIVVLFVFLGNVRSAFIAALIVPLSLLFAFVLMYWRGMSANLLSLGAIDFGVIIDGAVIMVEAIFARLALKHVTGESSREDLIQSTAVEMSKPIFFSIVIIIAAMLPIFSFQQIEGRMFSPLAYTLGFALIGAMLLSLTLVPVLAHDLLKGDLHEKSPIFDYLNRIYVRLLDASLRKGKTIFGISIAVLAVSLYLSQFLGTEFLPHLNEGALWVRATMPISVSPSTADSTARRIQKVLLKYDEVKNVVLQVGRPDDGTDATGFFNSEFFVDLKPEDQWKKHSSKDALIADMNQQFAAFPGIDFNFSQPISDNVEEAVTGVKGELAVKIFGPDLAILEKKAEEVRDVLTHTNGIADVGVFTELGQPTLQVAVDRIKAGQYGVNVSDVQDLIESAIGGHVATQFYEGEKHFDVVVRLAPQFRDAPEKIGAMLVSTSNGAKIPLSAVAHIGVFPGAAFIYRESNERYIAIKFGVRGRDMGGAVDEAREKVEKQVKFPAGTFAVWGGEFESQQRAMKRLAIVVPLSLLLILVLLYTTFDSWGYALLSLANVPFVTIGGILGLLIAGLHFSVSAGIGFIALFGVSIMNGVVLLTYVKHHRPEFHNIDDLLRHTCTSRVRPIVMVAVLAMIGLMPAALSSGIGSETQKPLAVVIVSGLLLTAAINLILLPIMFKLFRVDRYEINDQSPVEQGMASAS